MFGASDEVRADTEKKLKQEELEWLKELRESCTVFYTDIESVIEKIDERIETITKDEEQ